MENLGDLSSNLGAAIISFYFGGVLFCSCGSGGLGIGLGIGREEEGW